jgi:hypothetical protein
MQDSRPQDEKRFEPELYCLRCRLMAWDEEERTCLNFETRACPLGFRKVLDGLSLSFLVV